MEIKEITEQQPILKLNWMIVLGTFIAVFLMGIAVGLFFVEQPTKVETHTIEDTVSKQKLSESLEENRQLREKLSIAEKMITDLKVHTTEKVRIVYKTDGTKIVDKTTTTDIDKKTDQTTNTDKTTEENSSKKEDKVVETEVKTRVETKTVTVTMPKDKFYLGLSSTVGVTGLSNPGVEVKYRLLDLGKISGWVGAEILAGDLLNPVSATTLSKPTAFSLNSPIAATPVLGPQLRLSLGISF